MTPPAELDDAFDAAVDDGAELESDALLASVSEAADVVGVDSVVELGASDVVGLVLEVEAVETVSSLAPVEVVPEAVLVEAVSPPEAPVELVLEAILVVPAALELALKEVRLAVALPELLRLVLELDA